MGLPQLSSSGKAGEGAGGGGTAWMGFRSKIFESHESHGNIQASDKVVPVLGKNRCALGKCVSQKSCL